MSQPESLPSLDEASPAPHESADIRSIAEANGVASEDEAAGEASRGIPYWLATLVCLVLGGIILWQHQQASMLENKVAGLEQELRQRTALLNAHRVHLDGIRGSVRDLVESLSGLQGIVESDPERDVRIPFAAPLEPLSSPASSSLPARLEPVAGD